MLRLARLAKFAHSLLSFPLIGWFVYRTPLGSWMEEIVFLSFFPPLFFPFFPFLFLLLFCSLLFHFFGVKYCTLCGTCRGGGHAKLCAIKLDISNLFIIIIIFIIAAITAITTTNCSSSSCCNSLAPPPPPPPQLTRHSHAAVIAANNPRYIHSFTKKCMIGGDEQLPVWL